MGVLFFFSKEGKDGHRVEQREKTDGRDETAAPGLVAAKG